jgi:hypothetical protein
MLRFLNSCITNPPFSFCGFSLSPVEEEGFLPLAQIMPNLANVVNAIPVYAVQRAAQCSLCAAAIGAAEPHFVCVQCGHDDDDEDDEEDDDEVEGANAKSAPHAHCVACEYAPALATKVGSAALAHPHVCYFIPSSATAAQLTALTVSKDEVQRRDTERSRAREIEGYWNRG